MLVIDTCNNMEPPSELNVTFSLHNNQVNNAAGGRLWLRRGEQVRESSG